MSERGEWEDTLNVLLYTTKCVGMLNLVGRIEPVDRICCWSRRQ